MALYLGNQRVAPTVDGGVTPSGTRTITANGTYDVTNYASADVSVSGGGSPLPVYSHPELKGENCFLLDDGTDIPMTFGTTTINGSSKSNIMLLKSDCGFLFLPATTDLANPSDWLILNSALYLSISISNTRWTSQDIVNPDSIVHISFNFDNLPVSAVSQFSAATFQGLYSLESISISNMANLRITGNTFYKCSNLSEVDVSSVTKMTSGALSGTAGGGGFLKGTAVTTLSFYSLNSTSFGSYTNQFNNMLAGKSGVTVHFPSNLQSVIGNWTSVAAGFGGSNTTILFDLPATY
jgi:hypothetical protein